MEVFQVKDIGKIKMKQEEKLYILSLKISKYLLDGKDDTVSSELKLLTQ